MADSMRGSRLGSTSYEVDKGLRVPVQLTTYICPNNHHSTFPFYADAENIPETWTCECGQVAVKLGATMPIQESPRVRRSHYEILLERRSEEELAELLEERIALLHSGGVIRSA